MLSGSSESLSSRRWMTSSRDWWCRWRSSMRSSSSRRSCCTATRFLACRTSTSASYASIWLPMRSSTSPSQRRVSDLAFSCGSILFEASPSLEYALVFISFSHDLNRSICWC